MYDVEYRAVGKEDGVVRWVAAKGRAIFDSDGKCVRVIGTALDISKRKQATSASSCSPAKSIIVRAMRLPWFRRSCVSPNPRPKKVM